MNNNNEIKHQYMNTYPFTLPKGIIDSQGIKHDRGLMRMTTGIDELCWQQDFHTQENKAYGIAILLSRTVMAIGEITTIDKNTIENLLLNDFRYLVDFYNQINPKAAKISVLGKKWAIL